MAKIEGGCLCGAVRYESEAEPVMVVNCYCVTCRKNSGSTHSFNLAMPAGTVRVTGDTVRVYNDNSGASGTEFHRHFCDTCGTHFRAEGPCYEGLEFIKAGTLDDADWALPKTHIWCDEKLAWIAIPETETQIARNP